LTSTCIELKDDEKKVLGSDWEGKFFFDANNIIVLIPSLITDENSLWIVGLHKEKGVH